MKTLRERGATGFEVEILFRSVLQDEQIHYIDKLLKVVAKYQVCDKDIIDARLRYKLKLKYIKKSVMSALINQYKQDDTHYFTMAPGGMYYIENVKYTLNRLPLNADHMYKGRVLTFNRWALEKEYDLDGCSESCYWYTCTDGTSKIAAHYPDADMKLVEAKLYEKIVKDLTQGMSKKELEAFTPPPREIVHQEYRYEVIDKEIVDYKPISVINMIEKNGDLIEDELREF